MGKPVRAEVWPKRGERPERVIKRFIKRVKKAKIIETVRDNQYYEKPSVARNRIKQRNRKIRKE